MARRHNGSSTGTPPRPLGTAGKNLWERVNMECVLNGEVEREMLQQICEASDQIEDLVAAIKADGQVKSGKTYAGYTTTRQLRIFVVRSLERLSNRHRPTKHIGRPARSAMGISYNPFEEEGEMS